VLVRLSQYLPISGIFWNGFASLFIEQLKRLWLVRHL
jgi:hypothetical protein